MNVTGVRVKIFDGERCIYEREGVGPNDDDDLTTLLRDLREAQSGVNEFLTTLVCQRDAASGARSNDIGH